MSNENTELPAIQEIKERINRFSDELCESLKKELVKPPIETAGTDVLFRSLFGEELAPFCADWSNNLLSGQSAALALTGQWLLVRASDTNQFPNLLRPLGEAFYRWRPKTTADSNELEEALVRQLNKQSVEFGLRNNIELVKPGDRFDANRHHPLTGERGVCVDSVYGWIIMRDDRVFAKATVSIK